MSLMADSEVDEREGGFESALVVNESDLVVLGGEDCTLAVDGESELRPDENVFEGASSRSDILPGFSG